MGPRRCFMTTAARFGIVEVVPATADRYEDVLTILGGHEQACLCQYWRMTSGEYSRASKEARLAALRAQMDETPPPGMLAYVEGEPAGWLGFGVRQRVGRLVRSRTIPAIDDLPVWAIYCFTVRVGYRRQGLARALLAGLIEYAGVQGAPALEAYPRRHGRRTYPRNGCLRRGCDHVRGGGLRARGGDRRAQRPPTALADAARPGLAALGS